jgi:hypothetical protein
MEINYTYKLIGVKKVASFDGFTDIVVSVDFILSGEIPGLPKMDWALGDVPVDIPTSENFKPFDELTEEEIISWVTGSPLIVPVKDTLRRNINEHFTEKEYVAWNNEPTLMETQDPIIP